MKKIFLLIISLISIIVVSSIETAIAGDYDSFDEAKTIVFDKKYYGEITRTDRDDYYYFELDSAGMVTMEIEGEIETVYRGVFDEETDDVYGPGTGINFPDGKLTKDQYSLTKGGYYLKLSNPYSSGEYEFKLTFEPYYESFQEGQNGSNNTYNDADKVSLNETYTGFLAKNDKDDYYTFTLNKPQKIVFELGGSIKNVYFRVEDNNYKTVAGYGASLSLEGKTAKREAELDSGTYYIRIFEESYGLEFGEYTLTVKGANSSSPSSKDYDNPTCDDFGDDETDVEVGDDFWMSGYIDGNGCTITDVQISLFGPDTKSKGIVLWRDEDGDWDDYDIEDVVDFEWGDELCDWDDDDETIDTSEPGTYWIYVYVTTEEGLGFEDFVYEEFYVEDSGSSDPEVYVYLDDDEYEEGEEIEVEIEFYDDDELSYYEVYHDGDLVDEGDLWGDEDEITIYLDAIEGEDVAVEVYVYDEDDNEGYDWDDYDCESSGDSDPEVYVYLDDDEYEEGEEIEVEIEFYDDDELSYYEVYHDGDLVDEGDLWGDEDEITIYLDAIEGEDVAVEVYVYDEDDNEGYDWDDYDCESSGDEVNVSINIDENRYEYGDEIDFYVDIESNNRLSYYEIYHNDKLYSKSTSVNGTRSATVATDIEAIVGNGKIEVLAYDEYGHSGYDVFEYTCESKVPHKRIVLGIDNTAANVNGSTVYNDVAPIIVNNRTMLPARFVAESLGASVYWNDYERKVTIKGADGTTIEIYIDSSTAYVNGSARYLDSPAFISNSRTYTPVRFICEALGANVEWNEYSRQVTITK